MTQFNDAMECFEWVSNFDKGRGGGLVVSVLAFYSNDPSLAHFFKKKVILTEPAIWAYQKSALSFFL